MLAGMTDTIRHAATRPPLDVARPRVIDDPRDPIARRVADVLRNRSARPRTFIVDDAENIEQALRRGIRLDSVYVTGGDHGDATLSVIDDSVPGHVLTENVARALFGGERRARVFALAHAPRPATLGDLSGRTGDVVVLDGVRILGNIGAIIRSGCALGAAGLVLLDSGLTTTLDRRLVRASRGLVFAIPVVLAETAEFVGYASREELSLAMLSTDASQTLSDIRAVPEPLALVLGGERHGVSADLARLASRRYAIPMDPRVESLNVSVAAALALYEHRPARW